MARDTLLTSNEVVVQLSRLGTELDGVVAALKEAEQDAVRKRHEADMAESRAFVGADGAMEMRKHLARIAADKFEGDALVAEAVVRYLRQRINAISTRIEIGRSYGAAVRAEVRALGGADGP
jgi:hypothetical protein